MYPFSYNSNLTDYVTMSTFVTTTNALQAEISGLQTYSNTVLNATQNMNTAISSVQTSNDTQQSQINAVTGVTNLFVLRAGDTMSGTLNMGAQNITNVTRLSLASGDGIGLTSGGNPIVKSRYYIASWSESDVYLDLLNGLSVERVSWTNVSALNVRGDLGNYLNGPWYLNQDATVSSNPARWGQTTNLTTALQASIDGLNITNGYLNSFTNDPDMIALRAGNGGTLTNTVALLTNHVAVAGIRALDFTDGISATNHSGFPNQYDIFIVPEVTNALVRTNDTRYLDFTNASVHVASATDDDNPITLAQARTLVTGNRIMYYATNQILSAPWTNNVTPTNQLYALLCNATLPAQFTRTNPGVAIGSYFSSGLCTNTDEIYYDFDGQAVSLTRYLSENSAGSIWVKEEIYRVETNGNWVEWGDSAGSQLVAAASTPALMSWQIPVPLVNTNVGWRIATRTKRVGGTLTPDLILGGGSNTPSHISINVPVSLITDSATNAAVKEATNIYHQTYSPYFRNSDNQTNRWYEWIILNVATQAYATNWLGTNGFDIATWQLSGSYDGNSTRVDFVERVRGAEWGAPIATNYQMYLLKTNTMSNVTATVETTNEMGIIIQGNDGKAFNLKIRGYRP
jgi:hypothetical protein